MRPRSTAVFVTLMIIGIALPILYSKKEMDNKKAIRYAWQQHRVTAGLPPHSSKITAIDIDGKTATINLTDEITGANAQTQTIAGSATFILENGRWVVHKVNWENHNNEYEKDRPAAGVSSSGTTPSTSTTNSHIANVIIENEPYTFSLVEGQASVTSLANPEQTSLEYRTDNARDPLHPTGSEQHTLQLILRFNATKTGFYITGQENISLQLLRNGQVFEPATDCLIEVRTPYSGDITNSLSGMIRDCRLHSAAGVEYQLVMMEFAPSSMHESAVERPATETHQE